MSEKRCSHTGDWAAPCNCCQECGGYGYKIKFHKGWNKFYYPNCKACKGIGRIGKEMEAGDE
jgi:hypothetical protein